MFSGPKGGPREQEYRKVGEKKKVSRHTRERSRGVNARTPSAKKTGDAERDVRHSSRLKPNLAPALISVAWPESAPSETRKTAPTRSLCAPGAVCFARCLFSYVARGENGCARALGRQRTTEDASSATTRASPASPAPVPRTCSVCWTAACRPSLPLGVTDWGCSISKLVVVVVGAPARAAGPGARTAAAREAACEGTGARCDLRGKKGGGDKKG